MEPLISNFVYLPSLFAALPANNKLVRQNRAQDIEWASAKDLPFPQNIFMLHTRPEMVWGEQEAKPVLEVGKKRCGLRY